MRMHELAPWRKRSHLPVRHEDHDPFAALHNEMNRVFDNFFRGFETKPISGEWLPRVNITENDQGLCVTTELPGISEKDIDVSLSNDSLTIRGEKKEEKEEKGKNYYRSERSFGAFQRDIQLPFGVEVDKVEAKFKNGVLTISLPKSKEAQKETKKIEVKNA